MPEAFHVAVAALAAWSLFSALLAFVPGVILCMPAEMKERRLPVSLSSGLLSKDPRIAWETMAALSMATTFGSLFLNAVGWIIFMFYGPLPKSKKSGVEYAYAKGDGIHNYGRKLFKDVINQYNVTACLICQCEFGPDEDVVRLHCGHIFHPKRCLARWIRRNPRCPLLCNYELDPEIVRQIKR